MIKVLVFGTFDGIHEGHRNFFHQAQECGDYLGVVVARDETVRQIKGRLPKYDEQRRVLAVARENMIDDAVLGSTGDKYEVIRVQKPDVICLGYDQKDFIDGLRKMLNSDNMHATKIIRTHSHKPEIYKSSIINNLQNNKVIT